MIEISRLATEDFPVLSQVHEGFIPPEHSTVLIAKENGEIVGRIFLLTPSHLEGPWVREDKRGSTLVARLVRKMEALAKSSGISKMFAYAVDEQIANYLERMGYKKSPMTVWEKGL